MATVKFSSGSIEKDGRTMRACEEANIGIYYCLLYCDLIDPTDIILLIVVIFRFLLGTDCQCIFSVWCVS